MGTHVRRVAVLLLSVAGALALVRGAAAAPIAPHALVRGSQPAVYYVGTDGKRYAFPNERIYRSWYADFSGVTRVSDSALAAVPLGGVAHYKPAVRLVKVTTDPKVYAVAAGGVLRWVTTEALAIELYGPAWSGAVDDLPDAFFAAYSIGTPIVRASEFSVRALRDADLTLSTNLGLPGAPPFPAIAAAAPLTLPACSGQLLTVSPASLDAIASITPLGNLSPPAHVHPTDHTYWHLPDGQEGTWVLEPLLAPGDVTITRVRADVDRDPNRTDGGDEYAVHFGLCAEVEGIFGHVKTLAPKIAAAIAAAPCRRDLGSVCAYDIAVSVTAGEVIGALGGGRFRGVDLGVTDTRVRNTFANPQRFQHDRTTHAACPFTYFDADTRARLDAELPAPARGTCGTITQDVPGTLAGAWYRAALSDDAISEPLDHLAFSYEARNPAQAVISTGTSLPGGGGGWGFTPVSVGRVNRAFRDVTPDGATYCYTSIFRPRTRVLVAMTSATDLRIEVQETSDDPSCGGDPAFVAPMAYRR